jgi:hypothetical protein
VGGLAAIYVELYHFDLVVVFSACLFYVAKNLGFPTYVFHGCIVLFVQVPTTLPEKLLIGLADQKYTARHLVLLAKWPGSPHE